MKIYLCGPIDGVTPEWATGGNLRRGYWIQYHADKHFETLDEAIEYLEGIA